MQNAGNTILAKRQLYRKRRNVLRKLFLVLFGVVLILLSCRILSAEKNSTLQFEIEGNALLENECIVSTLNSSLEGKNFFFLSPEKISGRLCDVFPILKTVKIRKYLFPTKKIILHVREKELWGRYNSLFAGKAIFYYVSDQGDLVPVTCLNKSYISTGLIVVNSQRQVSRGDILIMKKIADFFIRNLGIMIDHFVLNKMGELEIFTNDSIRVKAGLLSDDLFEKIKKLTVVLQSIKDKSYLIEYIDLTLDKGVIVRKAKEDIGKKSPLKFLN